MAESLTALYEAMCATVAPSDMCLAAGVVEGSSWGQIIVTQHVKTAAAGDASAIAGVMNRVAGRTPDAAMTERQFFSYLQSIKSGPDAERIRQLVLEQIDLPPLLQVNFAPVTKCPNCGHPELVGEKEQRVQ